MGAVRCPDSTDCADFTYSQRSPRFNHSHGRVGILSFEFAKGGFGSLNSQEFCCSAANTYVLTFRGAKLHTMNSDNQQVAQNDALRLVSLLKSGGPVAVAFSGGVDSAVVARASWEAFGDAAVAVTAVSPSLAASELKTAREVAAAIGIRHVELTTEEFERPEYQANAGNRCFFCKDTLYTVAGEKLTELGVSGLVNGANTDDLGDHRPGMQAAQQHQVGSPLIEAGLNKSRVRELARFWNLAVADKPASPCLSSRIAYGVEVTAERVRRVEAAEAFLKELISADELRVRLEAGELARIELPLSMVAQVVEASLREQIVASLRDLGFQRVTLDLEGFRSGSLNDGLPMVELRRPN